MTDKKAEGHIRTRSIRFNLRRPTDEALWKEVEDEMETMRWEEDVVPTQVGAMKRIMVRGVQAERLPAPQAEVEEARAHRSAVERQLRMILIEVKRRRAIDPEGYERMMSEAGSGADGDERSPETDAGEQLVRNILEGIQF